MVPSQGVLSPKRPGSRRLGHHVLPLKDVEFFNILHEKRSVWCMLLFWTRLVGLQDSDVSAHITFSIFRVRSDSRFNALDNGSGSLRKRPSFQFTSFGCFRVSIHNFIPQISRIRYFSQGLLFCLLHIAAHNVSTRGLLRFWKFWLCYLQNLTVKLKEKNVSICWFAWEMAGSKQIY